MNYHRLKIVVFALLFGGTVFAASAENLLLAHTLPNGLPDGRRAPEGATVAVRDGKLNVDFTKPGSLQYSVYITPDHRRLLLSGELAGENLVPGQEGWQNGRIAMRFLDSAGKQAGAWPAVFAVSGNGTQKCSRVYNVPAGAVLLLVEPAHFGVSGKAVFRNLMLEEAPRNLLLSPNPNGIPGEGFDKGAVRATVQDGELCITINGTGNCRLSIPVAPEWKSLKFTMQWKLTDVKPGDADWKNARVAMRFYGPKGGVGDWPAIFAGTGTTGWIECSRVYEIPEGATSLAFEPANFGSSGKVEFKKLTLELDEMK